MRAKRTNAEPDVAPVLLPSDLVVSLRGEVLGLAREIFEEGITLQEEAVDALDLAERMTDLARSLHAGSTKISKSAKIRRLRGKKLEALAFELIGRCDER